MSESPRHRFGGLEDATDNPDQAIDDRLAAGKAIDIAVAWLRSEGYENVEAVLIVVANVPETGESRLFALNTGHSDQIEGARGDRAEMKLILLRMLSQIGEAADKIAKTLKKTYGHVTDDEIRRAIPDRKD